MTGIVENMCIRLMRERNYVSESSSSSDDEWEAALQQRGKRKLRPRIKGYGDVVHSYMDHELKSHFRMSKATFEYLLSIIGKDNQENKRLSNYCFSPAVNDSPLENGYYGLVQICL
ncbi:uncharacterized protein LOC107266733 [Cephus cinctus]|uniref:Uncharacterized protein LOC107266733 n=1 Tax=Cephus cinctus TaxID=211228 RepID=A0AAJ7BT90_CEPCN|nr:uncharacterized protein LOC107266733 [Cephus cinctus]